MMYDARLVLNGTQVWDQTGCCADRGYVWCGDLDNSSTLDFRVQEGCGGSNLQVDFDPIIVDGTAGTSSWNVFAYNSSTPGTNYVGYYTHTSQDFNTTDKWGATSELSYTSINDTGGQKYIGCSTGIDNFSYRHKRTGFTCGIYTINARHDDNLTITKDGSTTLYNAGCCVNTLSTIATSVFLGTNTTLDVVFVELRYLFGIAFYFCGYFMIGLIGFILPILFQYGLGQGMTTTATVLSASMSCSVIAAIAHVALARRWPRLRPFMLTGLALMAAGALWLGQSAAVTSWQQLLVPALLVGMAIPVYMGPVAFGTFTQNAPKVFSHAYQVKNIVRQLGLSSAIAVGTVMLEWRYAGHLDASHTGLDWAARFLHGTPAGAVHTAALAQACADDYTACGLLALALIPVVALQRVFR